MRSTPLSEQRDQLHEALLTFVDAPDPARFDGLAQRVVAHQASALPAYGRLVAARGGMPAHWRDAPLVPTALFRDIDLCSRPGATHTFVTSGTTAERRGRRRVPDARLYDAAMAGPFIAQVLAGDATPRPWMSLIPHRSVLPESSLSHMVTQLAETLASEVIWAAGRHGLDVVRCRTTLAQAQQPVLVLTTAFALVHLLDALSGPGVRLPAGSRMMLTGGFKGKSRQLDAAALRDSVAARLGITSDRIVDEYGMTELSSQAYGRPLVANPSLRLRVVDPVTLADVEAGEIGLVAAFDLLNLDNVSAILTSDLGKLDAQGRLTLLGRAPDAPPRGCSLSAEALGVAQ